MNIINKTFLKLALLPSRLYSKMGIDILQLKAILETKLTMDDRRPSAMFQTQRKKDKPIKAATVGTILISALMGIFFLFAFSFGNDMITSLAVYFSLLFVMLSATLISDFTSVLIDIRDSFIILPKPVSDRTFVSARLLHIFIHICKIVLPMSLPGFIYLILDTNWVGGLLFMLLVGFVALFSIFFINAVYLLILRITTPQKFQSIISYIQIIFAILIYGSYQILPRLLGKYSLEDFNIESVKGILFFPMYWFASAWSVIYNFAGSPSQWLAAVFAFILPFASLFIVVKYLAPSFNNKLAMINNAGPEKTAGTPKIIERKKRSYAEIISGLITTSAAEKMAFELSWKLTSRSRDFKIKVYPGIGYLIVYGVFIVWNSTDGSLDSIQENNFSSRVIIISSLYFTSLILMMALNQMSISGKYKASWIYYTSPIAKPGEIILGGAKAVMLKFYFPIILALTIAGIYLMGIAIIPHIILGMVNVLLSTTLLVLIGNKFFPFSRSENNNANTGTFLRNMMMLLVAAVIAFGHFIVYNIMAVIIIFILLSSAALWMVVGNIRNTSWASIKSRYADD